MTSKPLKPGDLAPNFTLYATLTQTLSLDQQRGSPVVLAFLTSQWSAADIWPYNNALPALARHGARLLAIAADSKWCNWVAAERYRLRFPLLADFTPQGAVATAYGVACEDQDVAEPALFVIDDDGIICWSCYSAATAPLKPEALVAAALSALRGEL